MDARELSTEMGDGNKSIPIGERGRQACKTLINKIDQAVNLSKTPLPRDEEGTSDIDDASHASVLSLKIQDA